MLRIEDEAKKQLGLTELNHPTGSCKTAVQDNIELNRDEYI